MARRIWPYAAFLVCFGLSSVCETEARAQNSVAFLRRKREWIIPPQMLEENEDYTKNEFIAKIRSDNEDLHSKNVRYSLKGAGADQEPFNLFVVNPVNGYVRLTGILDREHISQYNLSGVATFTNGTIAEHDIQLRIKVKDKNDNPPVFGPMDAGSVYELSPVDSQVMKMNCFDADEPRNPNSEIKYEIVDQQPGGQQMFDVNREGTIYVTNPNLDRESINQYVLLVRASDLNGAYGCNVATGTVTININDVNDNVPILEGPFEGSVEENTQDVEVMRIKASDLDLEGTDNWVAKCNIVSGNEGGYFNIHTDPKTNEAVLMLVKPVDYEDVKNLKLGIGVVNVAEFHPSVTGGQQGVNVNVGGGGGGAGGGGGGGAGGGGGGGAGGGGGGSGGGGGAGGGGGGTGGGSGGGSSGGGTSPTSPSGGQIYNVNINVINQPEGPKFTPQIKAIPVSENSNTFNSNEIIARYPAIDTDTGKEATNVRYAKAYDPDNWLTIDETTATIKMNKAPDRESKYLVNGTYYAKILSITQDLPAKTATGTIAIQVEDMNDHCPTLVSTVQTLCSDKTAILVSAVDEDASPNSAPFVFNIVSDGTSGKWTVEHLNDTTAIFRTQQQLWPGPYSLMVDVKDQQGLSCPALQKLTVDVCTCTSMGGCVRASSGTFQKGSSLGPAGIGLLFLGLLLLLLIPLLLLACLCGNAGLAGAFTEMPYDTKEHLIAYHTEGQGEDMLQDFRVGGLVDEGDGYNGFASSTAKGVAAMHGAGVAAGLLQSASTMGGGRGYNDVEMSHMDSYRVNANGWAASGEMAGDFDGMALPDMLLNNYYAQKSRGVEDGFAINTPQVYDYEGKGSPVGSVGCCSLLEDDNDLAFLNDLGPKFTTLAEICGAKKIPAEVPAPRPLPRTIQAPVSIPPAPKPVVNHTEVVSSTNLLNSGNPATTTVNLAASSASSAPMGNLLVAESRPTVIANVQPAPTLLVQQQPMYYMVEQQPSTVLLAERPAVGLGQSMYVLNGGPVAEGLVVQESNVSGNIQNPAERMVLLDHRGSSQALNTGLLHGAHLSGSQVVLVDGGASGGQVLQGTLQRGMAGTQSMILVDGQGGNLLQGSLRKGFSTHGGSQNVLYVKNTGVSGLVQGSLQKDSASSLGAFTNNVTLSGSAPHINQNPSPQKVVVQERKVITSQSIK